MKSKEYATQITPSHQPPTKQQWQHTGSNDKGAELW